MSESPHDPYNPADADESAEAEFDVKEDAERTGDDAGAARGDDEDEAPRD